MKKFCLFLFIFSAILTYAQQNAPSDVEIVQIKIVPDAVSLLPGEKVKFRFIALNAAEQEIPAAFEWSFSGGNLQQDGTFTAENEPGEHILEAKISTGIKGTAKITIRKPPSAIKKPAQVKIQPDRIRLKPGETCKFQFVVCDEAGNRLSLPLRLSYNGGKMDNRGNYTAGNEPGIYQVCVSVECEGEKVQGIAKVTILTETGELPPETLLPEEQGKIACRAEVVPPYVKLFPGQQCKFAFNLYDAEGNKTSADLSVSIQGGKLKPNGMYVAGNVLGKYVLEIATPDGVSGKATIEILEPGSSALDKSNAPEQGEGMEQPSQPAKTASGKQEDPKIASRKEDTLQTDSGKNETKGDAVNLFILPPQVKLKPGEKCHFRFMALDQQGNEVKLPFSIQFMGGKLQNDGSFVAGNIPGTYQIVLSYKSLKAVSKIEIEGTSPEIANAPGPLAMLKIVPDKVRLRPGKSQKFQIIATDAAGHPVSAKLGWTYHGGILQQDGTYTAGTITGQYCITLSGENISAQAIIAIVDPETEPKEMWWLSVKPNEVKLKRGETCRFEYTLTDDNGNPLPIVPLKWESIGGTFDTKTLTFTAGKEAGDFYLYAQWTEHVRTRVHLIIE